MAKQYAPWSEDTEDEGQPMTKEQMQHAAERAIAYMRRPRALPRACATRPRGARSVGSVVTCRELRIA
jgi:hypothetical protein